MQPNAEQMAILQAIHERHPFIAVNALAGTGKSTTVNFAVNGGPLQGRSVQYLVFNKKNADEAREKLPGFVKVNTAHSLAWNGTHPAGGLIRNVYANRRVDRLYGTLKSWNDPRFLGFLRSMKDVRLSKAQSIFLVQDILTSFCQSADDQVGLHHLDEQLKTQISMKLARSGNEKFLESTLNAAQEVVNDIFQKMLDPGGNAPVTHDAYLKIWSMGRPVIPADHILFDEAQDASMPMMEGVLSQTHAQLVFIGDTHQSIYGWRGAVDAMQALKHRHPETRVLPLQSSYRFGQGVADAGNVFLTALYEKERTPVEFRAFLRGLGNYDSRVEMDAAQGMDRKPTAYLFRGNAALVTAALRGLDRGDKVYMAGDQAKEIADFLEACCKLYRREFTPHPDLRFFDDFQELQKFTDTREGQGLAFLVDMVANQHGVLEREIGMLRATSHQQGADYTLSTMHRSKGLEFSHVTLDVGVQKPFEIDEETGERPVFSEVPAEVWRLLYVASTRAHETLYLNGLMTAILTNVDGIPQPVRAAVHALDRYRIDATPRADWETREFPPVPEPRLIGVPFSQVNLTPSWVKPDNTAMHPPGFEATETREPMTPVPWPATGMFH
ncbi:UvrD-helicase domain-containing protein [Acidithiobacillus sp. M4-SHS-6]|uniref:UvrD-helicase domain-containing protein n=1 Tax=Acidithiobacillus sp. M4-SHS-6 TaxID=3383024 RepID=UPI0039BEBA64